MLGSVGPTAASCAFRRGSKLKSRLPVHMYMTVAAAHRSEYLGQQWYQVHYENALYHRIVLVCEKGICT